MKKVLVTGADGFIGRYTLPMLVQVGFDVHALCWHQQPDPIEGVCWHRIDLMQPQAVDALLTDIQATHLLHLAWYTVHGKFWHASENLGWVEASLGLLAAFANHGGKRVVMAGSCAEYDWSAGGLCSEQTTACNPSTQYGVSKHELNEKAAAFCTRNQLSFAWGRVFFLYGPGEYSTRFVPSVINGLLNGEKVPCSDGHQLRDFMHVCDVASGFVHLLNSDVRGAVNIASGQAYTLKKIGEKLMEQVGGTGQIDFGALANRPDDPDVLTADVTRLQNELNWSPSLTLDEGLADTVDWCQAKLEAAHVE